jgi:hypothetical protein
VSTEVVVGLSRAASLRTQRALFGALGSPVTYAAFATGFAWMCSWQGPRDVVVSVVVKTPGP